MHLKKILPTLSIVPFLYSVNAFAGWEAFEEGYSQLRIGTGATWLSAEETTVTLQPYNQIDTLTSSDSTDAAGITTMGYGYVFPFDCDDCDEDWRFFPGMIVSLDGTYQFETQLTGDVLLYGASNLNYYDYEYGIENLNVLANLTLGLVEYQRWTIFALGGLGVAWTWVDYEEIPKPGVDGGNLTLKEESNTTFAWQAGGGIGFEVIPELDLTLTYLYTDLGDVETSSTITGSNGASSMEISDPANFGLSQQTVLLSAQWNFI